MKKSTFVAFVDMEKAFDWIDRELLFYKLLSYNVDGWFYLAIKSMYNGSISAIRLNGIYTNWFDTTSGVRQGDNLSPTLFNVYVNDLVHTLNETGKGIQIGDDIISV